MLRKIFITSAMLAASTSIAVAAPVPYVGASLGTTTNTAGKAFGNYRGMPLNVFGGYGGVVSQNFYVAGEVGATLGTAELSNHSNGLRSSVGYGASVVPGVMLSDHTLAFARLGVVRTHFQNPGNTATGGQVGIGLQTSLAQHLDLRGEYDYTSYRSIKRNGVSTSPRADAFNLGVVYKID